MNAVYQLPLPNFDQLVKLDQVERALVRVFSPSPSRMTIYGWLQDGTLVGEQIGRGNNWYVYTSSLNQFILNIESSRQQKMAA